MKRLLNLYDSLTSVLARLNWLALFLVRASLAAVFIPSGWGKLHNIPKVVGFFTDLGIPFPEFQAHLVASTEFVGGVLILVGLLTRLASIPLSITMVVALLTAKSADIHGVTDLFVTDEFIYIIFFVVLIVFGAGKFSLDALLKKKFRK